MRNWFSSSQSFKIPEAVLIGLLVMAGLALGLIVRMAIVLIHWIPQTNQSSGLVAVLIGIFVALVIVAIITIAAIKFLLAVSTKNPTPPPNLQAPTPGTQPAPGTTVPNQPATGVPPAQGTNAPAPAPTPVTWSTRWWQRTRTGGSWTVTKMKELEWYIWFVGGYIADLFLLRKLFPAFWMNWIVSIPNIFWIQFGLLGGMMLYARGKPRTHAPIRILGMIMLAIALLGYSTRAWEKVPEVKVAVPTVKIEASAWQNFTAGFRDVWNGIERREIEAPIGRWAAVNVPYGKHIEYSDRSGPVYIKRNGELEIVSPGKERVFAPGENPPYRDDVNKVEFMSAWPNAPVTVKIVMSPSKLL